MSTIKAVILARGLGTRMQKPTRNPQLNSNIKNLAEKGWKMLIPMTGNKPFLDYSLERLRKAGFKKVCLVIGPEHIPIQRHYEKMGGFLTGLKINFAIQKKPLGTADAVKAAKDFVGSDSFVVINGDNLYPTQCLQRVRKKPNNLCYVVGFEKEALVAKSNYTAKRLKDFAVMKVDDKGYLQSIVEKPKNPQNYRTNFGILINMNLFRFTTHIFEACERITPNQLRGEYELPSAVQLLVDEKVVSVKVLVVKASVLDLTYQADIPLVMNRLEK
jgi:glucose-1-phosphate thymidylyltransferase